MTFAAYSVERIACRRKLSASAAGGFASGEKRFPLPPQADSPLAKNAIKSASRYPLSAKYGFSLLELLVVILIISIALGFLTPLFRKTFLDVSLNSSAQDIVSLMRYARERAIAENTVFRLNLNTENGSYWLTSKEPDTEVFTRLTGNLGRLNNIAEGLKIEAQVNTIDFYPDGEAESFRIKLTNPNNKGLIITSKPGAGSNIVVRDEKE